MKFLSHAHLITALVVAGCASTGSGRAPTAADWALARVDDRAHWRAPALIRRLDEKTISYERTGNRVELLVNGDVAFARRYENARGAELLLVKTFIITDDEAGRRVAEVMMERAQAGAYVVLQYDVKGSIGSPEDARDMLAHTTASLPVGEKRIIRDLRAAGVVIVGTNSPTRAIEVEEWAKNLARLLRNPKAALERSWQTLRLLDHTDHEKYWITGRRDAEGHLELVVILGGMNLASEYAYGGTTKVDGGSGRGGWRDTDIEVRGPVVNDIVDRFFEAMDQQLGVDHLAKRYVAWNPAQRPAGEAHCRFVYNHPVVRNVRAVEELYLALIDATPAGGTLRLETAYYAPGRRLRKALKGALRRRARVAIITNSEATNDIGVVAWASRWALHALLQIEPTVAIFERIPRTDVGEGTLHSKVASFGTAGPVVVGSANLDAQSSEHNSESVLLVYDDGLRRAFDAMYELDLAPDRAARITRDVIKRDSSWRRFRQWGVHMLLWYWL